MIKIHALGLEKPYLSDNESENKTNDHIKSTDGHECCARCWTEYEMSVREMASSSFRDMEENAGVRAVTCPFCREKVCHVHTGTDKINHDRDRPHADENDRRRTARCVHCFSMILCIISSCLLIPI